MNFISPSELNQLINSSDEIAVIDVVNRENLEKNTYCYVQIYPFHI